MGVSLGVIFEGLYVKMKPRRPAGLDHGFNYLFAVVSDEHPV